MSFDCRESDCPFPPSHIVRKVVYRTDDGDVEAPGMPWLVCDDHWHRIFREARYLECRQIRPEIDRCDFCFAIPALYTYMAAPFSVTAQRGDRTIMFNESAGWAACDDCIPVIEERNALKLLKHVAATGKGDFTQRLVPGSPTWHGLLDMYRQFLAGIEFGPVLSCTVDGEVWD